MRVAVFTARSTGIGIATGVLVTAVFGQFVGASWGLAILAGLPAGALALAGSISLRNGKFDLGAGHQRRPGVLMLATGMAAYALGGVMATLDHLDGDDEIDPRLHITPLGSATIACCHPNRFRDAAAAARAPLSGRLSRAGSRTSTAARGSI